MAIISKEHRLRMLEWKVLKTTSDLVGIKLREGEGRGVKFFHNE
jgi:hypothetical protein